MVSSHNRRQITINSKCFFKKIISCVPLLVLFGLINTKAVVQPDKIKTYSPRKRPKFHSETIAEDYIVSKNLRTGEYITFCNIVELRNYLAKCQSLLKNFYEKNYLNCGFLVFNDVTLEDPESKESFSIVSWLDPLLAQKLPRYIETLDKIDVAFIRKNYMKLLPLFSNEISKNEFSDFIISLTTEHLVSTQLEYEDVRKLVSLIDDSVEPIIKRLEEI